MTATLTTVNAIMKEVYEGDINDQLQSEAVTFKRVESMSEGVIDTIGGKYIVFPVRTRRNHSTSYRPENVQLADPRAQGYAAAQESLKYGYHRLQLTGQVMRLADKNHQAFASAMDREIEGAKSDLARDQNRIVYGTTAGVTAGATGVLAAVTATATSTTVTVDTTEKLEVGMFIDVVQAGTPVSGGSNIEILTIPTATTFTVAAAVTAVNTNYVVRTGNWNNEPFGLASIVNSTGTLHNINGATEAYWRSQVDSATSTLTEAAMIKVADDIYRTSGKKISAIFCSLGVRRSYFNLMTSLRRYNEPKEFSGGLIGLAFNYGNEIPVVADIDCPAKHMFFLNEGEIKLFRDKPWYFEDIDGAVWKYVHNFDRFEALMKCYWQTGTHQRNAHGKMTNITEA